MAHSGADQSVAKPESVGSRGILRSDQILSRDWPKEVERTLEEYGDLLRDEDMTPLATSRIVTESTDLLVEFRKELQEVSRRAVDISKRLVAHTKKPRYKPRKLKELETAFADLSSTFRTLNADFWKLEAFCSRAIEVFRERFGDEPEQTLEQGAIAGGDDIEPTLGAYSAVREAELVLRREAMSVERVEQLDE